VRALAVGFPTGLLHLSMLHRMTGVRMTKIEGLFIPCRRISLSHSSIFSSVRISRWACANEPLTLTPTTTMANDHVPSPEPPLDVCVRAKSHPTITHHDVSTIHPGRFRTIRITHRKANPLLFRTCARSLAQSLSLSRTLSYSLARSLSSLSVRGERNVKCEGRPCRPWRPPHSPAERVPDVLLPPSPTSQSRRGFGAVRLGSVRCGARYGPTRSGQQRQGKMGSTRRATYGKVVAAAAAAAASPVGSSRRSRS
jgi:hypothetical protein